MITDRVGATVDVGVTPEVAFEVFTAEVDSWYLVDADTVADPLRTKTIRFEPYVGADCSTCTTSRATPGWRWRA